MVRVCLMARHSRMTLTHSLSVPPIILGTIGKHLVHYGVSARHVPEEERDYQKYYQWVSIFLMIHALIFCVPAYCWKVWERRTLERLLGGGLSDEFFVTPAKEERMQGLYNFFLHSHYRNSHRVYAVRYLVAEWLNLAAVTANVLLLNLFLQGFWLEFWPAVQVLFAFDYASWLSATARIFPRLAKCEFFFVGASGGIQSLQSLCLLPLNVLNEKIYATVYLWLLVLFVISAVNVVWKLLLVACRPLRMLWLRLEYREVPAYQWEAALDGGSYGQWFLFRRIASNLSTSVVHALADRLCHTAREEYYLK